MKIPEAKSLDGVFTLLPMDDVFTGGMRSTTRGCLNAWA